MKMPVTYDGITYEVNHNGELKIHNSLLKDISQVEGLARNLIWSAL